MQAEAEEKKSELADSVQEWLLKLEAGDDEAWQYHRRFTEVSLQGINKTLDKLDIEFDESLGESFYQPKAQELLEQLEKANIAERQADGSLIIDLTSRGIDTPLLVQKSNGALLYASSDMAALKYRQERWQPSQIIYVVGQEQKFHFKQLFAFNDVVKDTTAELDSPWLWSS